MTQALSMENIKFVVGLGPERGSKERVRINKFSWHNSCHCENLKLRHICLQYKRKETIISLCSNKGRLKYHIFPQNGNPSCFLNFIKRQIIFYSCYFLFESLKYSSDCSLKEKSNWTLRNRFSYIYMSSLHLIEQ